MWGSDIKILENSIPIVHPKSLKKIDFINIRYQKRLHWGIWPKILETGTLN